ncbi:hypothetical protein MMC19_007592 [Ptychographa xylographoides]|nr:hypothetical protein [Ptychographa xylographoides]
MFFSTSFVLKAALAVLLCSGHANAAPLNHSALIYSPVSIPSRSVVATGVHSMTNRTVAPVHPQHNETNPHRLGKRGIIGDLEAHWQFVLEESVCGDFGQVCFSPQANLWVDYYANGASSPTCSSFWDITVESTSNQLNGKQFFSPNCDFTVIFDANVSGGTVETFGAGYGVNCGWVSSWDHTSYAGGLWLTDDYYFHCTWGN